MRSSLVRLLLAATFLLCCAWGATGHKVVAQVAYGHLTPKARAEVDALLKGSSLPEYSIWADQIKSDPAWKWTKPWHFADMPPGANEFKMDRDCPSDGCVVKGIERYTAVLKSGSASEQEKVEALKFLTHYVGDIHQPLHVGDKADKGGNSVEVTLYSRKTNLHAVWDDGLIKQRGMEYGAYAQKLDAALKPETVKAFTAVMDPVAWATESHRLAEQHAYTDRGHTIQIGDTLGKEYSEANAPIVDEQLTKAGLRLAKLLNDIFDRGAAMPDAPPAPAPAAAEPTAPAPAPAPEVRPGVKFVGSRNSQVYHYPGCKDVQKIKPENLVDYAEAPEGKHLHQGCPR